MKRFSIFMKNLKMKYQQKFLKLGYYVNRWKNLNLTYYNFANYGRICIKLLNIVAYTQSPIYEKYEPLT